MWLEARTVSDPPGLPLPPRCPDQAFSVIQQPAFFLQSPSLGGYLGQTVLLSTHLLWGLCFPNPLPGVVQSLTWPKLKFCKTRGGSKAATPKAVIGERHRETGAGLWELRLVHKVLAAVPLLTAWPTEQGSPGSLPDASL